MATDTTGKQTPTGKPSLKRREAPPDHPIYTRGYVVGAKLLKPLPKPASATDTTITSDSPAKG